MEAIAIIFSGIAVVMALGLSGAMARRSDAKMATLANSISKDLDKLADSLIASRPVATAPRMVDMAQTGPIRAEVSTEAIDAHKGRINAYGFVYESVLQGGYRLLMTHARSYDDAKAAVEAGVKSRLGPLTEWRPTLETVLTIAIPKGVADQAPRPARPVDDYIHMIKYARDFIAVDPTEKVVLNGIISRVESKHSNDPIR